ncbi:MAG TPA: hypothetical protein VHP58_03655 [Alphaproteobacteria bacterium]|nr:hypothetical protein [Alphaproteobacteria bacterium]
MPTFKVVPCNAYTDTNVALQLFAGTCCSGSGPQSTNLTFSVPVETSADVSVVPSTTSFDISSQTRTLAFGNLTSAAQLDCDISIRSNSGYTLKVASANGQKLVQTPGVSTTIPYTISIGGTGQNLSGGGQVTVANQPATVTTPVAGTNLRTVVTIGTLTGNEISGNYRDDLSLTLSAN